MLKAKPIETTKKLRKYYHYQMINMFNLFSNYQWPNNKWDDLSISKGWQRFPNFKLVLYLYSLEMSIFFFFLNTANEHLSKRKYKSIYNKI